VNFGVIVLFCPLLDDCIICRIGRKLKKRGLTVLGLVIAQSIIHVTLQLYDVLRFDSTVVIYVFINTVAHLALKSKGSVAEGLLLISLFSTNCTFS